MSKTLSCPAVPNQHQQQVESHTQKTLLSRTRSYAPEEVHHPSLHAAFNMSHSMSNSMSHGMNGMSQAASTEYIAPLHQRLQRQLSLNPYEERSTGAQQNGHHTANGTHNGHVPNGVQNSHGQHNGHSLPNGVQNHSDRLRSPYEDISQKERMRLHYHLASLFPEDQVMAAMQVHPNETSAHVLCASILAMFPSGR